MASISKEPNGRRRIQFVDDDKRRKTIRLGKISQRNAETVRVHVEEPLTAKFAGASPHPETARWVGGIADELHAKLAAVGLVQEREKQEPEAAAMLDAFIQDFKQRRVDVKHSTALTWNKTHKRLV